MAAVDCTVIRSQMQSPRPGWSRAFSFLRLTVNTMAKSIKRLEREKSVDRLPGEFGATWIMWQLEKDENEDDAAAAFVRRHGSHPEHVVDHGGYLWLGPVPGQEGGV